MLIKKMIAFILLLSLIFSFAACAAANKPITDLAAFEAQVLADWIKFSGSKSDAFDLFNYYGADNGYHLLRFRAKGAHTAEQFDIVIAGYNFENLGSGILLMAYKDGEFIDLRMAYLNGLISEEAIAKAAELHNEIFPIDE